MGTNGDNDMISSLNSLAFTFILCISIIFTVFEEEFILRIKFSLVNLEIRPRGATLCRSKRFYDEMKRTY